VIVKGKKKLGILSHFPQEVEKEGSSLQFEKLRSCPPKKIVFPNSMDLESQNLF